MVLELTSRGELIGMIRPFPHKTLRCTAAELLLLLGCGARTGLPTGSLTNDVQSGGSNPMAGGANPTAGGTNGTQPYVGGHEASGGHAGVGGLLTTSGGANSTGGVSQAIGGIGTGGAVTVPQALAVSAGVHYTCALLSDGTVKCWGSNDSGQLGNNTTTDSTHPSLVLGLKSAAAIASGDQHTCALLSEGTVYCWGDNYYGELGNGTTASSAVPVPVYGITSAASISAGYRHTCALLQDHSAWCWGDNSDDQLGVDYLSLYSSSTPIEITTQYNGVAAIGAGRAHTCAIPQLSGGAVTCWGSYSYWKLGDSSLLGDSYVPITVIGVTSASALAVGDQHNCALISLGPTGGVVRCWGWNHYGQLGTGSPADEELAANVFGISSAIAISASDHSCALLYGGDVQCWGFNSSGQLGNGTMTDSPTPVSVVDLDNVSSISAGYVHTCALLNNAQVKCWGDNYYGELGDGTTTTSTVPVMVNEL